MNTPNSRQGKGEVDGNTGLSGDGISIDSGSVPSRCDQEGSRLSMRDNLVRNSTTRVWGRGAERRLGVSRLLAQALELTRQPSHRAGIKSRLERDIGYLLNARSVSIRENAGTYQALAVREGPGVLTMPLPGLSDPSMVLEVRAEPQELDAWARQLLSDVVRIASLVMTVLADTPSSPAIEPVNRHEMKTRELIGRSAHIDRLRDQITRMARTGFTVLVEGESGSGKELVARLIHQQSDRHTGPFIGVNCAALVETLLEAELFGIEDRTATGVRGRRGKFELADEGTLFLDEVSDLTPAAQAKLLRAIQERSVERVGGHATRVVDTRIVVATNQSLKELVAAGRFRSDLFYRLSGVEIHVPPLRVRQGDIAILANHFLEQHRALGSRSFSDSAMDALSAYAWPGNVRELERVVERAVTLATASRVMLEDLPPEVTGDFTRFLKRSLDVDDTMRTWGSRYARLVLERCHNNKRQACRSLGISYHTLQAYLTHNGPVSGEPLPSKAADREGETPRESEYR